MFKGPHFAGIFLWLGGLACALAQPAAAPRLAANATAASPAIAAVTAPSPIRATTPASAAIPVLPTGAIRPTADAAPASNSTIAVVGSDLLQTAVGEPLARYVRQNGLDAKVDLFGTAPGDVLLREGKASLALVAVPPGQKPASDGYTAVPYCYEVAYILVNSDNLMSEIDQKQLMAVFGTRGTTVIARWGELGQAGPAAVRAIVPVTTSSDDGVVLELFKNLVLDGDALRPGVQVLGSPGELAKMMVDKPDVLAVSGSVPPDHAKALMVAMGRPSAAADTANAGDDAAAPAAPTGGGIAHAPSEENVNNGSYPLRLPFYLVFKTADKDRVRELLRVLLSTEYAGRLRDQHFVPVSDTDRKRTMLELDIKE